MNGIENAKLDPCLADGFDRLRGKAGKIAKIVENDLDLHTLARLLLQNGEHPLPKLALGKDEVLKENEAVCLFHITKKLFKHPATIREVGGFRLIVD